MKRIILLSFAITVFVACKKDNKPTEPEIKYGTVIFYTLKLDQHYMWEAVVDGVNRGKVPYTIIEPPCENNNGVLGLFVKLKTGEHEVYYKSLEGYAPGLTKKFTVEEGCQTYW